jgi:NDP-sugar pyrophosphorylase family protein
MIPALVLTAGLATRLRPLSLLRAKAVLPVAGVPLVRRILRGLRAAGVEDVVLNLHHLPHTVTRVVGDGSADGVRVRYSWEVPILGSAGGPRRAVPILGRSPFLVVNGDTLTDVSLEALVADHTRSGALVTMAATPNTEPHRYGGLLASADGTFTGVVGRDSPTPSWHFVGVQVVAAEALDAVPYGAVAESVRDVYPSLAAARPGSVRVFRTEGEFFDIGTPADYLRTNLTLAARERALASLAPASQIDDDATVTDAILWEGARVGRGVTLRRSIVTDGAHVPDGTSWDNAIMRRVDGPLAPGESLVHGLAVSPLGA